MPETPSQAPQPTQPVDSPNSLPIDTATAASIVASIPANTAPTPPTGPDGIQTPVTPAAPEHSLTTAILTTTATPLSSAALIPTPTGNSTLSVETGEATAADFLSRRDADAEVLVGENDILCARARGVHDRHPGNMRFQEIILKNSTKYMEECERVYEKIEMVNAIMKHVADTGGRFLILDKKSTAVAASSALQASLPDSPPLRWVEMDVKGVRDKIGHSLRGHYRKQKMATKALGTDANTKMSSSMPSPPPRKRTLSSPVPAQPTQAQKCAASAAVSAIATPTTISNDNKVGTTDASEAGTTAVLEAGTTTASEAGTTAAGISASPPVLQPSRAPPTTAVQACTTPESQPKAEEKKRKKKSKDGVGAATAPAVLDLGPDGLRENDIVCYTTRGYATHPGNILFHEIIDKNRLVFSTEPDLEKRNIIKQGIYNELTRMGCRFVRFDKEAKTWLLMTKPYRIVKKIGEALVRQKKSATAIAIAEQQGSLQLSSNKRNFKEAKPHQRHSRILAAWPASSVVGTSDADSADDYAFAELNSQDASERRATSKKDEVWGEDEEKNQEQSNSSNGPSACRYVVVSCSSNFRLNLDSESENEEETLQTKQGPTNDGPNQTKQLFEQQEKAKNPIWN